MLPGRHKAEMAAALGSLTCSGKGPATKRNVTRYVLQYLPLPPFARGVEQCKHTLLLPSCSRSPNRKCVAVSIIAVAKSKVCCYIHYRRRNGRRWAASTACDDFTLAAAVRERERLVVVAVPLRSECTTTCCPPSRRRWRLEFTDKGLRAERRAPLLVNDDERGPFGRPWKQTNKRQQQQKNVRKTKEKPQQTNARRRF